MRGVLRRVPAALVGDAMSSSPSARCTVQPPGRLRISERTLEDLAKCHATVRASCNLSDPGQHRAFVAIMRSFDALLDAARAGIRAEVARCGEPPSPLFGGG